MVSGQRRISADSHLDVSPERWRDRVPEEYRDCAPRRVQLADADALLVEGQPLVIKDNRLAGEPPERWLLPGTGMQYEEMPGAGSPEQRLQEQDRDGIDAEILFPEVPGRNGWSTIKDNDAHYAVVRAYNDWLAEDYCAVAPDRLIGLGVIPERGLKDAITELERCARLGLKGVVLNAYPNGGTDRVTRADDEFWVAAVDLQMPIAVHERPQFSGFIQRTHMVRICSAGVAGQLASTAVFDRFPTLQVYIAEFQVARLPNLLDLADVDYKKYYPFLKWSEGLEPLSALPSEIIKEHCLWGFVDSPLGVQFRHYIGVDNLMWSNNFPQPPSRWPHSGELIDRNFQGVPEVEKDAILAGNCTRFFRLET